MKSPSVLLMGVLKKHNMSLRSLEKHLHVGHPALLNILNGKGRLTANLAARLERATAVPAMTWLTAQAEHDLKQNPPDVDDILPLDRA